MKRFLFIIPLIIISSCEDPITVNIHSNGESKLVVEGVITNQMAIQEVKLSMTSEFLNSADSPRISNGVVQVIDNTGSVFDFSESSRLGTYLSNDLFQGQVNSQYKLQFALNDGRSYESDFQELKSTPEIELSFEESLATKADDYIIRIETNDSSRIGDFYRWKLYKNDQILGTLADVFLRSDRLFNGNRFDVAFDVFLFEAGDTCRVEQFSLTETAFDFFRLIQIQASDVGESNSTAPTEVIGNIRNVNDSDEEVLGFFYATSTTSATTIIE